ncbi:MAG: AbrB/MazE/SpoVT family DNA-binding domain-containing protein [Clostridia bacterium]|nr:AbrB/MazE/SpoVT family DNA-binding domain-containing protein [Clostridia bacterium]
MNGIEKEIDGLGRVVIPIEYRKRLGFELNSKVVISAENGMIQISPINKVCVLCGKRVEKGRKLPLCPKCVELIKSE